MSRAAYNLEFFPRRRSGFKDAGFAMEQFSQVITGDCFVYSKHASHLFLMLDLDPQSPDHTSVTFTEQNRLCALISRVCQGAKSIFFLRSNRSDCCSCSGTRPKFQRCPVNCRARFVHPSRGPNRWVPIYPLALPALCHYKCFSMIFFTEEELLQLTLAKRATRVALTLFLLSSDSERQPKATVCD